MIFTINLPPMGKARPRVTHGHAYLPAAYRKWKSEFCAQCVQYRGKYYAGTVGVYTLFTTKTGNSRSDLDNAHAAVLDGLQDALIIRNDRNVKSGGYGICKGLENKITITITEI